MKTKDMAYAVINMVSHQREQGFIPDHVIVHLKKATSFSDKTLRALRGDIRDYLREHRHF